MVYYTKEQFIFLTDEIADKIYNDLKATEKPSEFTESYIFILTRYNGELINFRTSDLVGLELNDEKPTVYKTSFQNGKLIFNHVEVIFDISRPIYHSSQLLVLEKDNVEFHSYEEFLGYFTKIYLSAAVDYYGKVNIQTCIKGTRLDLSTYLVSELNKMGYRDIGRNSYWDLDNYCKLPDEIKKKSDALLGTFTVQSKDVIASKYLGNVEIKLELGDILKENCQTDRWDEQIQSALKLGKIDLSEL